MNIVIPAHIEAKKEKSLHKSDSRYMIQACRNDLKCDELISDYQTDKSDRTVAAEMLLLLSQLNPFVEQF